MHFSYEEIKFNAIESLGWDYFNEEAYFVVFSTEEFLNEEDPNYILEEVNTMFGEKKFESLGHQSKNH